MNPIRIVSTFTLLALCGCSTGQTPTPMDSAAPPPSLADRQMDVAAAPAVLSQTDGPFALAQNAPVVTVQTGRKLPAPEERSHLRLSVRLTEAGGAELVDVAVLEGTVVGSHEPAGDYLYEVMGPQGRLALESLSDPFELRGYPAPVGSNAPPAHAISRMPDAVVVAKVPAELAPGQKLSELSFNFYRVKAGYALPSLDEATVDAFIKEGKVELKAQLPAGKFGAAALGRLQDGKAQQ